MAINNAFDWRRSDRRLFAIVAICFAAVVLIGFARTYYLKFAFESPVLPSALVHIHGLVMSTWVAFFVLQVWLIRSKKPKVHMNLGMIGIVLAILVIVVGFFTAAAGAKNGSTSSPPDVPPLAFFVVPFVDLVIFAGLFAAAIYYRNNLANHKRLMLLTAVSFLPPAVARIPIASLQSLGPLVFFGVPAVVAIGLLVFDRWRTGKLNKPFLIGAVILIASYPTRIAVSGTEIWIAFATWVTSWTA